MKLKLKVEFLIEYDSSKETLESVKEQVVCALFQLHKQDFICGDLHNTCVDAYTFTLEELQ